MGQYEIMKFLEKNKGKKFTSKEILENMDVKSVSTSLKKLREKGFINFEFKKSFPVGLFEYWAKEDD